jgi:ribosomal protein S20
LRGPDGTGWLPCLRSGTIAVRARRTFRARRTTTARIDEVQPLAKTPRTWTGARTPSGLKRVRQSDRRRAVLQPRRSAAKTFVTKALTVATAPVEGVDPMEALRDALSALDKAAKVGAIHPNAAARRKSRLTLKVNAALGGAAVQTAARITKTTGKAAAVKAAKARIAAGKAGKAKGAQTAAGKARAALSKTARADAAAAAARAEAAKPSDKTAAKTPAAKAAGAKAPARTAAAKSTAAATSAAAKTPAKPAAAKAPAKAATAKAPARSAAAKPARTPTAKPAAKKPTSKD